jgi:hypothetical protein
MKGDAPSASAATTQRHRKGARAASVADSEDVEPGPPGRRRHKARRWVKVAVAVAVGLAALVGIVYVRAVLTLDSSTFSRALIWVDADVDDFRRFPSRRIDAPADPYVYEEAPGYPSGLPPEVEIPSGYDGLESFLRSTETTAFIVVARDRLLYEHYFSGHDHDATQTSFSVAKSFASALVGIAVDDGVIDLDDPITNYIPELKERGPGFERITIRHLKGLQERGLAALVLPDQGVFMPPRPLSSHRYS